MEDFGIMKECPWFARRVKLLCLTPAAACYFAWGCFDESVSSEVVVGPKICLYWIRDSSMWPAACLAGLKFLRRGMTE